MVRYDTNKILFIIFLTGVLCSYIIGGKMYGQIKEEVPFPTTLLQSISFFVLYIITGLVSLYLIGYKGLYGSIPLIQNFDLIILSKKIVLIILSYILIKGYKPLNIYGSKFDYRNSDKTKIAEWESKLKDKVKFLAELQIVTEKSIENYIDLVEDGDRESEDAQTHILAMANKLRPKLKLQVEKRTDDNISEQEIDEVVDRAIDNILGQ
jgi:hypothetical protein